MYTIWSALYGRWLSCASAIAWNNSPTGVWNNGPLEKWAVYNKFQHACPAGLFEQLKNPTISIKCRQCRFSRLLSGVGQFCNENWALFWACSKIFRNCNAKSPTPRLRVMSVIISPEGSKPQQHLQPHDLSTGRHSVESHFHLGKSKSKPWPKQHF